MTENPIAELLNLSAECANLAPHEVLDTLLHPEWDKAERMYDWRNHVNSEVKRLWFALSDEARLAVFYTAAVAAYDEEGWGPV